ncbi:MAG: hypothetical protein HY784_10320 [Chloroflexi bacterium]|nr:hypothetical protein [Chloroflexota bacterium]
MPATTMPDTVVKALGPEASRDFALWIESVLEDSPRSPISALVARQKVNVLLLEHVSNLLLADDPELKKRVDGRWVWRVPVDLTFPSRGRVGRAGELEVGAVLGEIYYSDSILTEIRASAHCLARETLHPTP